MRKFNLLAVFLKYRILLLVLLLIDILRNPFYLNFVESSDRLREFSKYIFLRSAVLNQIIDNGVTVLNKQFHLLQGAFTNILLYFGGYVLLCVISAVSRKNADRRAHPSLVPGILIILWSFIYVFCLKDFPPGISFCLMACMVGVAGMDFILFFREGFFDNKSNKNIFAGFFTSVIFLSELFCAPLYWQFLCVLQGKKFPKKISVVIQHGHFMLFMAVALIFLSPLESPSIIEMRQIKKGQYYGLQYYKDNILVALNDFEGQVERIHVGHDVSTKVIYRSTFPRGTEEAMGERLALSPEREEVYFTDRKQSQLIVADDRSQKIKAMISSDVFDMGDNALAYMNGHVYGLTEEKLCVYKIDMSSAAPQHVPRYCINEGEGGIILPNGPRNVLYAANWNDPENRFFIYEIDGQTLDIHRRFPMPAAGVAMAAENGKKLYCIWPRNLYVLDAGNFRVVDKMKLSYGLMNTFSLDDTNQLVFGANHFTNIIEVIDLKTKKTVQYFRAGIGNSHISRITVDAENKNFYATVFRDGIYMGHYE